MGSEMPIPLRFRQCQYAAAAQGRSVLASLIAAIDLATE
jgi:hypothetical protein